MPTGLKGSISGPGTDYFTGRPTVSSLVSTCKSFCSYLTSVYHKGFPKGRYLKKKSKPNLCLFLLRFSLNHLLSPLFLSKMCFAQDRSSCSPARARRSRVAAELLPDMTQSLQAAPGSARAADTVLLRCCSSPQKKKQAWFAAILGSVAVVYPAAFSGPAYSLVITGRFLPCLTHGFFAFLTHHSPSQGGQVIT